MIILGKSNKEKGKQLEVLCKELLSKLGYNNCITNLIGSGGEEIDVVADFSIPRLGKEIIIKTICECKAYQDKVSINHWLKFLGKIYSQEKKEKKQVQGCFIALNGVNGNVQGHYNDIHRNTDNIQLITQNEIL